VGETPGKGAPGKGETKKGATSFCVDTNKPATLFFGSPQGGNRERPYGSKKRRIIGGGPPTEVFREGQEKNTR